MRNPSPKLKKQEATQLPGELLAFLIEVHEKIKARDESTLVESDDLLQREFVYGGRDSESEDRFTFTYFPEPGIRQKWVFSLTEEEIAEIVQKRQPELLLWACTQPGCRCRFQEGEGPECFYCDWDDPTPAG